MSILSWWKQCLNQVLILVMVLVSASAAMAQGISEGARAQIRALQLEKASRSVALTRLDSQLVYAIRAGRNELAGLGITNLQPNVSVGPDGRVLLDIDATVTPALLNQITQAGGQVVGSVPRFNAIRARLSLAQIEALAVAPGVRFMQPAVGYITHTGSLNSEGDATHSADLGRSVFHVNGAGVNVGVLSDSNDHQAGSQATGDLPPDIVVLPGQSGVPASGEGTAMMEIVHDLAPGAKLFFASAFGGPGQFAQNILDLRGVGCDVIVDDVFYFNESPFQDGVIAQAVNSVTDSGALYFSSAGNSGNKNDGTSGTWEGDFVDGGPVTTPITGNGLLHSFGATPYNTVNGRGIATVLFWSDPLGGSTNDYDLYVLDAAGTAILSSSTTVQNGTQDPFEIVPSSAPGTRIVVVKSSGDARFLHVDTIRGRLAINTDGNIKGHAAAINGFGVAAVDAATSFPDPFSGGAANPVETFSTDGPRRSFYHPDGSAVTPGNFLSTGGLVRQKPDIAAADGVVTATPGFNPFFGTSAAAPHAAAIAALLLSYNPDLTPAQIRQVLTSSALDIEAPGFDRDSGDGLIMALQALAAAPVVAPAPNLIFVTNFVSGGNDNGIIDIRECNNMNIILTNRGRAGATSVRATLSTPTPGVVIARPTVDYPNIPVDAAGTNLIPFTFSTTPWFNCGAPVDFVLEVKTTQNTTTNRFTLPSGVPTEPVSFFNNTQILIPDADPRGTNSTVVVTNLQFALTKVTVSLFINHSFDGDLALELISPDGTTNTLSANNGFFGDNYGLACQPFGQRTTFDDAAPNPITASAPPFVGSFRPEQPLSTFNGKSGTNINGIWRLRVVDSVGLDIGLLNCWTLTLTTANCPDGGGECPGADMAIGLSAAPEPALVGGNLIYTITVTNRGPSTATNVIVSQNLPGSTIFGSAVASQGNAAHSGGVVTAHLGIVAPLAVATVTVVVTPGLAGEISSSAAVTSNQPDFNTSNNSATFLSHVSPPTCDLVVGLVSAPNPVIVGGSLVYTVNVTNRGPSTATGVTLTNILPPSVAIISSSVSQGSAFTTSNRVVCTFGTLTNGGRATATITVIPSVDGAIIATSTVIGNQLDPLTSNNSVTNSTTVGPAADLVLALTDTPDPVVVRSNVTYQFSITNQGPSVANNVVLNGTLPANVLIVSSNTSQGILQIQGTTLTATLGTLQNGGSAAITVVVTPTNVGQIVASATLSGGQSDPNGANNNANAATQVATPFVSIVPAGATLTAESIAPANGAIDHGETVTVSLRLRNGGNSVNTNLVATLLATNGVTPVGPNTPQTYGVLAPSGFPVGRTFTFSASGTNGASVNAVLQLQDGPNNLGLASFNFVLPNVRAFANTNVITIRDNTNALPYPSTINVSGLTGVVGKVTATLWDISHTFPQDIDALVVGPTAQKTILMSGAGAPPLTSANVTFDDTAASAVPDGSSQILSASYRPASYTSGINLPPPAPTGPYPAALSAFTSANPNGTWSLFVADHFPGDVGAVSGGWSLGFTLISPVNQLADLALLGAGAPNPVLAGSALNYTFTITNAGPNSASFVAFTNLLPPAVTLLSASVSQGAVFTNTSSVVGNLGSLSAGAVATVTISVSPSAAAAGSLTNVATVSAAETDLNLANNSASVVSTVNLPIADVALSVTQAPTPAVIGLLLTNRFSVTNIEPGTALDVALTNTILPGFSFLTASSTLGVPVHNAGVVSWQLGHLPVNSSATLEIVVTPSAVGTFTNTAQVWTRSSDPNSANNSASSVFSVIGPAANIVAAGARLTTENGPPNGAVDPGETVTVDLALRNVGSANASDVLATLQNSGGVSPVGPAQKPYGSLSQGGNAATNSFTFVANGTNGGVVVATLFLVDAASNPLGAVAFSFALPTTGSFSNTAAITIPNQGAANPYPSTIQVSGMTGLVNKITVSLKGLTHSFPRDVNALLVSPTGDKSILMSHAGGPHAVTNLILGFDDAAGALLPSGTPITAGTFKPSAYGAVAFPAPAPAAPYPALLNTFIGKEANGTWSLYVFDDSIGDNGTIAEGWSLELTTASAVNAVTDLSVAILSSPVTVFVGAGVTHTISVTNVGPSQATAVTAVHPLALGSLFISANASQGTVNGPVEGSLSWNVGDLAVGAGAQLTILESPSLAGTMFNSVTVSSSETDPNAVNNSAQANVNVFSPTSARLSASLNAGEIEISVMAEANLSYVLQASSNMVSWTAISTNTAVGGTFKYVEPASANTRFYRAIRHLP